MRHLRERGVSVRDQIGQAKTAFVFAGGGSFGAIQVGMLHSLTAHGISADMVVGSSVGALNGAFYAGDPTLKGVERLGDIWRALKRQDVFPMSWRTVLSFLWRRDFLISHDGIRKLIDDHIPYHNLQDASVPVKIDAAQALARYGSAAAESALFDAFAYWSRWWNGRAGEINDENQRLERALSGALSQGSGWLADGEKLKRISALCQTEGCRQETAQSLAMWRDSLEATVDRNDSGDWYISFAQYHPQSPEELKTRLLQLPAGVPVTWRCREFGQPAACPF